MAARAEYVPYARIGHATEGLSPLTLTILNDAGGAIVCTAQLAHWYAADLGRALPGQTVAATLWHNPGDGALALLNDGKDRMPIEAVWCAPAGDAGAPRSRVTLPVAAGPLASDTLVTECRQGEGRLVCDTR